MTTRHRAAAAFLLSGLVFAPATARALISTSVEPIIGYERVQMLAPTPHTTERMVYGARAVVGVLMLSAEAEVTRGQSTELFPLTVTQFEDKTDKARLGLLSSVKLLGLVSAYLRAGGQASQSTQTTTVAGT